MKSHPLLTALHHTFLWFFTGSLTVAIMGLTLTLFGESISSNALATMISITFTTFIPYAVLLLIFWLQTRSKKQLKPDRVWSVWSIITICLHSLAALAWSTTLVVSLLTSESTGLKVGAALSLLVALLVAIIYSLIAFVKLSKKGRLIALAAYVIILIGLISSLFTMSVLKMDTIRHDESLRKELVSTTANIRDFTFKNSRLPLDSEASKLITDSAITYKTLSDSSYELCTEFKVGYKGGNDYQAADYLITDEYVYEGSFVAGSGTQCFEMESYKLGTGKFENY